MGYYINSKIREEFEIPERDYLYWGAFMLESLELLSKLNLTSIQFKTLLFLCSRVEQKDNVAYVRQKNIYEELELDKSNLSRAIKKLRSKNLIAKVKNGYMINPNLFYLGKKRAEDLRTLHHVFQEKMKSDSMYSREERLPFEYLMM